LRDAFDNGHDAVLLRNYTSPGGITGDILIVKDGKQLRSVNAAFDASKRESRNLMHGIAGAAPVGLQGLGQAPTDAPQGQQNVPQQADQPFSSVALPSPMIRNRR
jgi:hypothetical protein